jgi:hypothetical protein
MKLSEEQVKIYDNLQKIEDFNDHFNKIKTDLNAIIKKIHDSKIDLESREKRLEYRDKDIDKKSEEKYCQLKEVELGVKILIKEKSKSFPWLADAIADYLKLKDDQIAEYLISKKNPAISSSEKVKEVSLEKRILTQQLLITRYRLKYYESLFPFLTEYNDESIDDLLLQVIKNHEISEVEEGVDPVNKFVTQGEYENLTTSERNQKALDRYLSSTKTPYQIGRDYERYIGYLYETKGYSVNYHGIEEGIYDLGRDLICKKNDRVEVVQCKYWAKHKTIHEKHINQLFGTTVKYFIDLIEQKKSFSDLSKFPELLKSHEIKSVFYTSTNLSDTAQKFAKSLDIEVHENENLKPYPMIKCHINKQTGEKIYHLPFDQMYDRTIIEKKYGEFYAINIKEAESKGFRRAWKWTGNL